MLQIGDITLLKAIGKGSYGEVYLSTKAGRKEYFATKRMDRKRTENPKYFHYFNNEINILKSFNHPNIVKLEEIKKTNDSYYVVMEYVNGGNLKGCLEKYKQKNFGRPFSEDIVQYLMSQIIDALKYIHQHNVIHRDLKTDNIMVSFDNEIDKNNLNMLKAKIKIIDFGVSFIKNKQQLAKTYVGTPINMAPEFFNKVKNSSSYLLGQFETYDEKVDIWSIGTVCYELLVGQPAFTGTTIEELKKKIEIGQYIIPQSMSQEAQSFLDCMLKYNPEFRLNTSQLLGHPFLAKLKKTISIKEEGNSVQDQLRRELVSNKIDVNSKKLLYQVIMQNNLNEFINIISKGVPILEELSPKGYYWTTLHFAMNNGKMEIVLYILEELKKLGLYDKAMALETNNQCTPLLCLIKSNDLNFDTKAECLRKLVERFPIKANENTLKEMRFRNLEDIYRGKKILNKAYSKSESTEKKISLIKCTYEILDTNTFVQIINYKRETPKIFNKEIESKIKIYNNGKKENLTLKKKFDKIGNNIVYFIIEEKLNDMSIMFSQCTSLKKIEFISFETDKVTKMVGVFNNCKNLEYLDLSTFNTSNVTSMEAMFNMCEKLKEIKGIEKFNTSKVTNFSCMFEGCFELKKLDLSNFRTYNVTNMSSMFQGCRKLQYLNLYNFNTSKVTDMAGMFNECRILPEIKGIINFDTSQVLNMELMFQCCLELTTLDLSNFNTSKVTNMAEMFNCCFKLNEINGINNFDLSKVKNMSKMFDNCYKLTKVNRSKFNL